MSEVTQATYRPTDTVGRYLYVTTRSFAIAGGVVFCLMSLLTAVSVIGRAFFDAPVMGDFEMIAVGTGVGVFLLMPYCQLVRENVIVDFFLSAAPDAVKAFFDALGCLIYGGIMAVVTWRMWLGGFDMYDVDETTMILAIPRWSTFPLAVFCLFLLVIVCTYTFIQSVREIRGNRPD